MRLKEKRDLIKKYNAGTCSEYERNLVEDWYLQLEVADPDELSETDGIRDLNNIWKKLPLQQSKIVKIRLSYRIAAAAVLLIFLSIGIYFVMNKRTNQEQVILALSHHLKPGSNKAILTLSNGNQIVLSGSFSGQLARQSNTAIIKTAYGKVIYQTRFKNAKVNVEYNTLSTPLGGTYALTLSDGTTVILDAASSIRYPVVFAANERKVEITGQAYFEVAHDKAKPFRVVSENQTVEVLGTHFNINAYKNEGIIRTTLLEGSVKVTERGQSAVLVPGQQSINDNYDSGIKVEDADMETTVAWKNGVFKFKRADLQSVMRQFARWYDVEVVYDSGVPDVGITGKVSRSANAEQILKILNNLGIRFKIDGKKLVVLKD